MNYKKYIKNGCLILPSGFNSDLYCYKNKLTELVLPEGFNSSLSADAVVYTYKEWKALERNRKIDEIFIDTHTLI